MPSRGLALAAMLGALCSGCGGGSSSSSPSSGAIEARDFEFSQESRTVKAGEKVTWENTGEQIHNVKGKGFFSRAIDPGESYSSMFRKPGTYDYVCTLHPQMKGTIRVD
jgi:plastocyanin